MSVRLGFIGSGGIARRHLGVLQGLDDAAIVAAADTSLERAQAFASDAGGATPYDDWRAMLDAERLDALYICVPPFAHGEPELAAVDRGLPFFVEKPLAADAEVAEHVGAAVEAKGLITAVGYHWRYLDTVEHVRGVLAERPARLVMGHWLESTPPVDWWGRRAMSGGQMVEQTTHLFDLARHLIGEVRTIYATGQQTERSAHPDLDIETATTCALTFENGAVGTMTSTCLLNWRHDVSLKLFGDDLAVELTDTAMGVYGAPGTTERGIEGDPVVGEDRDFLDAVQGRENRIRCPYAEALKTHRLTMAAQRSLETGLPVHLS